MFGSIQLSAFVLSAVVSAAFAQTTLPADCARNYTVHLGDTCDGISAAHSVSTFQLAHVNSDRIDPLCDNLALGEPLCLGITGQDCSSVHIMSEGEFCAQIAQGAGIDVSTMLANNPNVKSDCSNIYPGEVLCMAASVIHYT